jgi:hypothetical protein
VLGGWANRLGWNQQDLPKGQDDILRYGQRALSIFRPIGHLIALLHVDPFSTVQQENTLVVSLCNNVVLLLLLLLLVL